MDQDISQRKGPMLRHKQPIGGKRTGEGYAKATKEDVKRPFRRLRSPSLPRSRAYASFKPAFKGKFNRPHPVGNENYYKKFRRYTPQPRSHPLGNADPKMTRAQREKAKQKMWAKSPGNGTHEPRDQVRGSSPLKENSQLQPETKVILERLFPWSPSSREKDNLPFYSREDGGRQSREIEHERTRSREREHERTRSRERERERDRTLSSAGQQTEARQRAIQMKRREIEEVYRWDCDTFGAVVQMLIAKDPSLEAPIQFSLKENLREIGNRCVEAMQRFIEEYDSREPSL